MTEFLKIEKDGHILRVTLNRPERRNALSTPICHGLIDLPAQVEADMDISCVVSTGAGEGLCSGADLKERKEETRQHDGITWSLLTAHCSISKRYLYRSFPQ